MSDLDFEILDNLYFLTTFSELLECIKIKETELELHLKTLYTNGYIKIMDSFGVKEIENIDFIDGLVDYTLLISKSGLLYHNSR